MKPRKHNYTALLKATFPNPAAVPLMHMSTVVLACASIKTNGATVQVMPATEHTRNYLQLLGCKRISDCWYSISKATVQSLIITAII